MAKSGTVVIPAAFAARWLQICVAALKQHKNATDFDILIVDNSPGHPSIKTITETRLGEGVKVVDPPAPNIAGHQVALDMAIDMVETPWFITWETDVQVLRDGWLDWLLSFAKDEYVAIIGWYWAGDYADDRHYISPAGALYRTRILKMLKEECLRNKDMAVCYGRKMDKRIDIMKEYPHTGGKMINMGIWGPFLESRGFGNVYPYSNQKDHWTPEPGNWVYNRCSMQWEVIHLPGRFVVNDEIKNAVNLGVPYKYTDVGPEGEEAYFRHHWAGTVSKNFVKHKIPPWDMEKMQFWLKREYRIWEEVVPEDVRKLTLKKGLVMSLDEEYALAQSQVQA